MKKTFLCILAFVVTMACCIDIQAQNSGVKKGGKTTKTGQVKKDSIPVNSSGSVTIVQNPGIGQVTTDKIVDVQQIIDAGNPVVTGNDTNKINWTQQYIETKGYSVMDTASFKIPGQAELMAMRGAVVIAQRNLLEIIQGMRIVGETKVKDCVTTGDYVYTRIDGVIKGAEMVGDYVVRRNIIEVTMRVPLYRASNGNEGVGDVLLKTSQTINPNPTPDPKSNPTTVPDEKKVTIDPSLFPVVVDSCGSIIFDYRKYYDPTTGKIPQYIEVTQAVADMIGAGDKVDNVIKGVKDVASGKITVKGCNDGAGKSGQKVNKWMNIIGKVVDIGKWIIALF